MFRINGLKHFVKKSISEELYYSIKKEHLIDLYFKNKDEPYEDVINITLDEEAEEQIEYDINAQPLKNNLTLNKNSNFFENYNSEMQNKIEKYNEEFNYDVNCNSYLYDTDSNNYSNNSKFEIYKIKENSKQINQGPNSNMSPNINYHSYPYYQSADSNLNCSGNKRLFFFKNFE